MNAQKKNPVPAEIAQYEKLVATLPGVERKGADNPYSALNGNMFSLLLSPGGRLRFGFPRTSESSSSRSTRRRCLKHMEP